jgi:hypothetical protein
MQIAMRGLVTLVAVLAVTGCAPAKKKHTKQELMDTYKGSSSMEFAKLGGWTKEQLGEPHKTDGENFLWYTSPPEPCFVLRLEPKAVGVDPAPDADCAANAPH